MTKLTYWKEGPTQELPNQLVLQTGHRNTLAKSVPWTLSSTNVESDLLLRLANSTSLVPIWHGAPSQVNHCMPKDSPNQPPTIIYKTAAKDLIDQDPRTTHLEGNLGLNLNNKQSTQVIRQPPLNVISAVATTIETYTVATTEWRFGGGFRPPPNEPFGSGWDSATAETSFGGGLHIP